MSRRWKTFYPIWIHHVSNVLKIPTVSDVFSREKPTIELWTLAEVHFSTWTAELKPFDPHPQTVETDDATCATHHCHVASSVYWSFSTKTISSISGKKNLVFLCSWLWHVRHVASICGTTQGQQSDGLNNLILQLKVENVNFCYS